jgi:hypothetical protein
MHTFGALREYRFYARMPLPLEAELRTRQSSLGRFSIRDIDMGGAFVEVRSDDVDLYPNDVVELLFAPIAGDAADRGQGLRARVARVAPDGLGLMFIDFDQASLNALLEVMATANECSLNHIG